MFNVFLFKLGKTIAGLIWKKFATPEVINKTITNIEDKYPLAKAGIEKFNEVVGILENLTDGDVSKQDLEAFVQFFYRLLTTFKKK